MRKPLNFAPGVSMTHLRASRFKGLSLTPPAVLWKDNLICKGRQIKVIRFKRGWIWRLTTLLLKWGWRRARKDCIQSGFLLPASQWAPTQLSCFSQHRPRSALCGMRRSQKLNSHKCAAPQLSPILPCTFLVTSGQAAGPEAALAAAAQGVPVPNPTLPS